MTHSPSSEASHDSGDEHNSNNASSKLSTLKDKECQYCHQKFTSSSLGRHLDQFVSKKKPDGIHDVDEIRRLRGGITRRTARSHKKEQDEEQSTQHSPSPQYTLPSYSELLTKTTNAPSEMRFNRMNWQATGVITDPPSLNPATTNAGSPSMTGNPGNVASGTKRTFSTYASDLPSLNSVTSDTARALELSLREVLDAVRTATKRALSPQQPFSFDFAAQTFPYLCLALLPAPATLFTPTPFATAASVSLSPPGLDQYQTLRKVAETHIDDWKWTRLSYIQRTFASSNFSEEMENVNDHANSQIHDAIKHIEAAYHSFMSFSPESRQSLWTIEILRAYKQEQDKLKEANTRVERLVQETQQLQQQIDHLSKCQWPREMALWPPDRMTFNEKTRDELSRVNLVKGETHGSADGHREGGLDDQQNGMTDRWDYDLLVTKWQKHVREDRGRRTGTQPSMPFLPVGGPPSLSQDHLASAPSEHSTVSTPRLPSGPAKTPIGEYRGLGVDQSVDAVSTNNSPNINGGGGNRLPGPPSFDSRRRNVHFVSDTDDIFAPRWSGLRADGIMKSATP